MTNGRVAKGKFYRAATPRWAGFGRRPPIRTRYGLRLLVEALRESGDGKVMPDFSDIGIPAGSPGFSSGSAAIVFWLSVLSRRSPERQEVIIPAYTCFSVPAAVRQAGLKCTICDTDPTTFDFDLEMLRNLATERTLCIVSTQLFEAQTRVDNALEIAAECGAELIEDRAQGAPDSIFEPPIGSGAVLSFAKGKPIGGAGGGILLHGHSSADGGLSDESTNEFTSPPAGSRELLDMLAIDVLGHPSFFWMAAGLPYLHVGDTEFPAAVSVKGMSGVQALVLRRAFEKRLKQQGRINQHSRAVRRLIEAWSNTDQPPFTLNDDYAPARYPFLLGRPYAHLSLQEKREAARLGMVTMYPMPVNDISEAEEFCTNSSDRMPGARELVERMITIPCNFPGEEMMPKIERVLSSIAASC